MKVVLLGDYPSLQADRLRELLGPSFEIVPLVSTAPPEAVAGALADADVIVSNRYQSDLPPAPRLGLLQSPSAGLEAIDLHAVPEGAVVAAAQGHEIPMAEFALCAMLDQAIRFRSLADSFENGQWAMRHWIKGPVHGEVFGRTVGLLGYGGIAQEIARRAKAFGMTVRALSRWSSGQRGDAHVDAAFLSKDRQAFLDGLDYLVVTLPLTAETNGSIDAGWFAALPRHAVVIHQGRGPVINEADLYEALRNGSIGGAVLDVWYAYPKSDTDLVSPSRFPFHTLDNVVMTPHGSGRSHGTFARRWDAIAENIRRHGRGEPPSGLVRRD